MSEYKSILQLTKEADLRDQPYLDTIKSDLIAAIDTATIGEVEYKVIYDIDAIISTLLPLQQQRITLKVIRILKELNYAQPFIDENGKLTFTWTITTLTSSL